MKAVIEQQIPFDPTQFQFIVAKGVNAMRGPERAIVLVTHYQRLLDYVEPDFVHVLSKGRIVRSGDKSLALQLEEKGYEWVQEAATA